MGRQETGFWRVPCGLIPALPVVPLSGAFCTLHFGTPSACMMPSLAVPAIWPRAIDCLYLNGRLDRWQNVLCWSRCRLTFSKRSSLIACVEDVWMGSGHMVPLLDSLLMWLGGPTVVS